MAGTLALSLPTFMEETVQRASDEFFRQYDAAEKAIDRVPWTRQMTTAEKMEAGMTAMLGGPEGWGRFMMQLQESGMDPERALKEYVDFVTWFTGQLNKDGISATDDMGVLDDAGEFGL